MPAPPQQVDRRPHRVLAAWAVWWALLAALWLALVDTVVLPELATGATAAAIGATGAVIVRGQRRLLLRPRLSWLRGLGSPLARVLLDLGPLARVLWRRGVLRRDGAGVLVEVPYAAVEEEPEQAAHRVFTETLGSLAPNTIVVAVDRDRRVLLVHQLAPDDPEARAKPLPEP